MFFLIQDDSRWVRLLIVMAYMLLSVGCLPIGRGKEERGIGDREREEGKDRGGRKGIKRQYERKTK